MYTASPQISHLESPFFLKPHLHYADMKFTGPASKKWNELPVVIKLSKKREHCKEKSKNTLITRTLD